LKSGFVIVGNVPTTDGTFKTIKPGSLQILNSSGTVVKTLTDSKLLAEPWDLAVNDQGDQVQVFVSNLSKFQGTTGTVTRLDLTISSGTITVGQPVQIASGYTVQANQAAVVLGPTGLAFDPTKDTLYVASPGDNAIYAIPNALETGTPGTGTLIFNDPTRLNGPLGLVLAPNGDLITTNGDAFSTTSSVLPSELVEFTPTGHFVAQFQLDPVAGSAFGLALGFSNNHLFLAAVDDNTNSLDLFQVNG
jgi:DNA-binding beta-propeller fold protein YncE